LLLGMGEMFNQRVPVMIRTERNRPAFLTSPHVVDDLRTDGTAG
jgi:hypothetical protein